MRWSNMYTPSSSGQIKLTSKVDNGKGQRNAENPRSGHDE